MTLLAPSLIVYWLKSLISVCQKCHRGRPSRSAPRFRRRRRTVGSNLLACNSHLDLRQHWRLGREKFEVMKIGCCGCRFPGCCFPLSASWSRQRCTRCTRHVTCSRALRRFAGHVRFESIIETLFRTRTANLRGRETPSGQRRFLPQRTFRTDGRPALSASRWCLDLDPHEIHNFHTPVSEKNHRSDDLHTHFDIGGVDGGGAVLLMDCRLQPSTVQWPCSSWWRSWGRAWPKQEICSTWLKFTNLIFEVNFEQDHLHITMFSLLIFLFWSELRGNRVPGSGNRLADRPMKKFFKQNVLHKYITNLLMR